MSSNQERRAEARQRLREQMEAQARREKVLRISAASIVVVLLLGLVAWVAWRKYDKHQAEVHAANWMTCDYPASDQTPQKVDPKTYESQGADMVKKANEFNAEIDTIAKTKRAATAPEGEVPRKGTVDIDMTINGGPVPLHLDREKAPCNVASFTGLVQQKFFDDSPCHRLTVADKPEALAVLQCGDPTGTGMSGPGYSVKDEVPTGLAADTTGQAVVYPRGTLAMAKSQEPDSGGSQFFLVYKDSALPPEYSVMGTIGEDGLATVQKIADAGVKSKDTNSEDNQKPKKPVKIGTASVVKEDGTPEK